MLEDYRIKVFATVCKTHSFTRAAQLLDVTQPSVSQNIAELERALGVTLFTRGRSEAALTPEGESFKAYADRILYWCARAEEKFMNKPLSDPGTGTTLPLGGGRTAEVYVRDGEIHIAVDQDDVQ